MRFKRTFAPAAASLGMLLIMAACAPSGAEAPSPTSQTPSVQPPADSPMPSPTSEESPSPETGDVIELELPMIARATEDDVDVYARPSTDAPLLTGEQFPDMNRVEIRLAADERVSVTLGPLVSEGTSWYQVHAVDGGPTAFGLGWVSAEFLAHDADAPESFPQIVTDHGQGSDGEISTEVVMGTPITVDVAAAPMEDQERCDLDVTLIRSDGMAVNVATQTVTEPDAFQLGASIEGGLPSLFQEEAGTVTLRVATDCGWAASLTQPPG